MGRMKVYLLQAVHWYVPGKITQVFLDEGLARMAALEVVNRLRDEVGLPSVSNTARFEEALKQASEEWSFRMIGTRREMPVGTQDDAGVWIEVLPVVTKKSLREDGTVPSMPRFGAASYA